MTKKTDVLVALAGIAFGVFIVAVLPWIVEVLR